MKNQRKISLCRRLTAALLVLLVLMTDSTMVKAVETSLSGSDIVSGGDSNSDGGSVSGGDSNSDGGSVSGGDSILDGEVSVSDGDSVSGGDSVSAGDATVSDGDAPTAGERREPEPFHAEPEPENYGELVSYDAYSRTYHVEENRYITVVGNDSATYLDEEGSLRSVDNTLIENPVFAYSMWGEQQTSYINRANDYTVYLPETLKAPGFTGAIEAAEGNGITILSGDYLLTMYPAEGNYAESVVKDNAIRYSNVFPDVDYQYTVLGNSVKEDIILLKRGEKNSFSGYIDAYGLEAALINNTLYLHEAGTDPETAAVFVLEAPEMEDANGEISFGLKLSLSEENGLYLVTVTANEAWLADAERAYPVRIDPTAIEVTGSAIRIACAEEGSPNTVIGDNQYPYVGYDDGVTSGNLSGFGSRHENCRSYFAIDYDFAALGAEAEITQATFFVTQKTRWSRGNSEFGIFGVEEPWEIESLTWNNQLAYTHCFLDSQMASTQRGEALAFDVTGEVSAWINGTAENHGLVLKAMTEAPNEEAAADGVKMQCEVFYNNASARYAPKLVLSWTGEPTDLASLTLFDTTIDIYPVVERNGDKSTNTIGVAAHGLAKPGSMVTYSLVNGTTGETEAQTSLQYPDTAAYAESFPTALAYNRRLSNWQSELFTNLIPGQVYYVTAEASFLGEIGNKVQSEPFLIYEEGAFDLIPRIANHYGVDVNIIMADMQMQDALTKEGNRLFIRNPQNTAPYSAGELSDYYKAMIDGLLLGRAENCEFAFEPINLNTGNFYMEQTDASMIDIGGDFTFTRQYNAKGAAFSGMFGYGWSTPYDERLGELADGSVLWRTGTGSIITFAKNGDGYLAPAGCDYTLTQDGEGYTVFDRNTNEKHLFNAYGLLTAIEDICGNRTVLSYDLEYRLSAITSPSGKTIGITTDKENRIAAITLPDGKQITYTYDGAGNLSVVTDEAGDTRAFSYDEAHRMTGWQDENGHTVITNIYDGQGRVIKQIDAEGGVVTLSYGEGATTATDALGNVTVYYYDSAYRTTKIEYPDGTAESRIYNEAGYLSSLTDRLGTSTAYTYDAGGHMLEEARQDGTKRSYTYTPAGQIETFTDYDGAVTRYGYDEKNRLIALTDAEGNAVSYAYDEKNRLISMTDGNGAVTAYAYEGACVTEKTDAEGNTWHYSYDACGRELTATDPEGSTTEKTYDAKGRCIKETDGAGNATLYEFDGAGNVIAITDREGETSTFIYDKLNRMLKGTDPLGNTLSYIYDKNGNKLTETDAEGNVISYTYDAMNRPVSVTDALLKTTLYIYDGADRVLTVTDRRGYERSYSYDKVTGSLLSETDERGNVTLYENDACGRVEKITYADGSTVSYTYDRLGQMTAVTDKLGTVTRLSYDACGNLISLTEGEGRSYSYAYDALGRLVQTKDPLGGVTGYIYDGAGNLISFTDERGSATAYAYDSADRLITVTDAEGGVTSYSYDKEGRLLTAITPQGRKTAYTYDAIGELVKLTEGLCEEEAYRETAYTYDALGRLTHITDGAGTVMEYTYDAEDRMSVMTDALGNSHTYTYDAEGRLLTDIYPNGEKETYTYLGTGELLNRTDRYGVVTTCTYDEMGRLIKRADSTGNEESYTYDRAGNLIKTTDALGRSIAYEYDAFGRLVKITEADGAETVYTYDALDRPVSVTDAAGNETTYAYDGTGNLIQTVKPGEAVTAYAYDGLNRPVKKVDAEGAETAYAYDKDGCLVSTVDGNGTDTYYAYDALSRLLSYTDGNGGKTLYTYDNRDNLLSVTTPEGITEHYGYDGAGNLTAVTDGMGETTDYTYDNLYRLIKKTTPQGAEEHYAYDSHDVVTGVTDALGAVTAYETGADGLVRSMTLPNGGVYTYSYDAVHRLTGITTPLGYEKTFTYSVGDDIIKEEDSLGRTTLYEYDILHNLTQVTDAEGGVTAYAYDVRGNRTAGTNALGNTFFYDYDKADRMIAVTDPEERVAAVTYDRVGNAESITLPGNRTTAYTYDGNYNVVSVTDPKGYVYGYAYDKDDRLIGVTDPLGQTEGFTYDAADRLTAYTDKMGLAECYTYDAHGNMLTYTDPSGLVSSYAYDLKDRMESVTDPSGITAHYSYDVMDNLTRVSYSVTGEEGVSTGTAYTYDLMGNLTSITDASGRKETLTYDEAGRLTSYTGNGGSTITYDYNKLNSLVEKSYSDEAGETAVPSVQYAYDALGERVSMYDSTGDTTYTYDALGRVTSVTTCRTAENADSAGGDTITYTYNEAGNLAAITYPDGKAVHYEYDLNDNLVKVTDRDGNATTYEYDAINRITEIHRPNGISIYNTYNGRNQITELVNICDECEWVVSRYVYTYDERGFITGETATESLAGYAYDEKHDGKHEDGKHDALYPHGNAHNGKHDKDSTFAYRIVETSRSFTYDESGRLLSCTETEDNYGTYTYTYTYDGAGNRTSSVKTDAKGAVVESAEYVYNDSNQLVKATVFDGKKTGTITYTYDADGNLIAETGKNGAEKVELTYTYTVENRLEAVYDGKELLMAAAYDGDGNRVFQLNYNLHTDDDRKDNSGSGNGSNKDNAGAGNSGNSGKGSNGKNNGNKGNSSGGGTDTSTGSGNATNAEANNSQNQCGILFPIDSEVSSTEEYLISLIKTTGKEKDYELIEYVNDVNREYAEVLAEQNINGAPDTAYVYGTDRLSLDRFDGSTGYYLYDGRGSVTGITNEAGQVYQSYRYGAFGEVTFGVPQYENEYTYNGESYNPNIESQYLRARYYDVVTGTFITEDFYPQDMWKLWDVTRPLTFNRYGYCMGNPVNYVDKSGHSVKEVVSGAWENSMGSVPIPSYMREQMYAWTEYIRFTQADAEANSEVQYVDGEDVMYMNEKDNYDYSYVASFIMKFEDFSPVPYYPTKDEEEEGIKTIGYGHKDRKKQYSDDYYMTEKEAFDLLVSDIKENYPTDFVDAIIESHGTLTQNQLDALVALRFNNYSLTVEGSPNFLTLLKQKSYSGYEFEKAVVDQFLTYTKQNETVLGGLVKRSVAEAMLFLEGNYFENVDDLYADPETLTKYKDFLIKYNREDILQYIP
ncbi:MAG: DNRLRE domain-containing protein [Lachnospiraceae bacterium]|nr:DNRLRE domain-containing protein [Lachnospiraceae bacterium]